VSVGILLITHRPLGTDLLRIATGIFGACPAPVESLEVENDAPCELLLADAERMASQLDRGDGVLVLTDIYGSTPSNLAVDLQGRRDRIRVLAGVNLPMLVRALNYAELDLDDVVEKALTGGRDGVLLCARRGERDSDP
jgi:PTS system ascorbate-specific IIA component